MFAAFLGFLFHQILSIFSSFLENYQDVMYVEEENGKVDIFHRS